MVNSFQGQGLKGSSVHNMNQPGVFIAAPVRESYSSTISLVPCRHIYQVS